ncbi:MAG: hypothetical protein IKO26_04195 [Paludibacteraceae bacterium]|nr:hypothetical protein [Paludibacteraceae bacterium]
MESPFYDFWRQYAPQPEYRNRYRACEKVWNAMEEPLRQRILYKLRTEQTPSGAETVHSSNPYFYLIRADPQPEWLSPGMVAKALAAHTPLAVALDSTTQTYKICTRQDADAYGLTVHHYM